MMQRTQFEIIADIARIAASEAESGWSELMIKFYIEGIRSAHVDSYLVASDGHVVEKPLSTHHSLDQSLRELHKHLTEGGEPPFTHCKFHLWCDGRYDVSYGYEPVDWKELLTPDWNFFPIA